MIKYASKGAVILQPPFFISLIFLGWILVRLISVPSRCGHSGIHVDHRTSKGRTGNLCWFLMLHRFHLQIKHHQIVRACVTSNLLSPPRCGDGSRGDSRGKKQCIGYKDTEDRDACDARGETCKGWICPNWQAAGWCCFRCAAAGVRFVKYLLRCRTDCREFHALRYSSILGHVQASIRRFELLVGFVLSL